DGIVVTDADTPALPVMADAANVLAAAQAAYGEERDLVNQLLGQAQMAGAFEEFSRTVRTSKLAYVKENKLYRALAGKKTPHGAENLSGTWEEFCSLLGRSVDQVDRDIANLRAFGEEALESMSRMGIGYRELRQFRKLPEDQKTALIEVAKSGDKESFVELAEEVIAKHAKEKAALKKEATDLKADLEAKEKVMADKNSKIDQLSAELAKLTQITPEAQEAERQRVEATLLKQLQDNAHTLLGGIHQFAQTVATCMEQCPPESALQAATESTVQWLFQRIDEIAKANLIPVDFAEMVTPSWMQPAGQLEEAGA
ncbi:hypothetical protein, partial [Laribacter hongkongensis]